MPILDAAEALGLKVGPPRGAAVLRAGAGQRRVTVLDGVAALSGGLREEGEGSVTVVDTSAWRWCRCGGGDGGGDTLPGRGGGSGGGEGGRGGPRPSPRNTAGSCTAAGPGTAQGRDRGSTEDRSGARVECASPDGAVAASGDAVHGGSGARWATSTGERLLEAEVGWGTEAGSRDVTAATGAGGVVGGEGKYTSVSGGGPRGKMREALPLPDARVTKSWPQLATTGHQTPDRRRHLSRSGPAL